MKSWYKLAKEKILYVMRGVSGSGKSTKARSLPGVTPENIFETDALIADNLEDYNKFFESMIENEDWTPLVEKHQILFQMISDAMDEGRSPLVLDNTNLEAWEPKDIVEKAINSGYRIEFVDVGTGGLSIDELELRNKHGVDRETLQRMIDKYESEGTLTVEKVLESEKPEF